MSLPEPLSQFLQQELSLSAEEVERIWLTLAKALLFYVAFRGAVPTPFGKLALQEQGLAIVEQNKALVEALAENTSREAVQQAITRMVLG